MNLKEIDLFLFDLDGTLADTDGLIFASYRHVFHLFRPEYTLSEEELISFLGPTLESVFARYFQEEFPVLFAEYKSFAESHTSELVEVYPDTIRLLGLLKKQGKRLGVVTSRFYESAVFMLTHTGLKPYFETIVSLDDVARPKPDPEGILHCMEQLGVPAEKTLYIGDNESDYLSAKRAHTYAGLVSWARGRDNASLHPDLLIRRYADLVDALG